MISTLFNFFTTQWQRIIIYALLALLIGGGLWVNGFIHGREQLSDYKITQALKAAKIIVKQGKVTEKVVVRYIEQEAKTKIVTKTIEKEVIKYVNENPDTYTLDDEWGRLHDDAATNTISESSGTGDGTSREAPTAAEALQTVTENYAICNRNTDKLNTLQEWIREQEKINRE